jgi:phosphomannomutase
MPIIASISGIRGTLGGKTGDCLTPAAISRYTAAFAQLCQNKFPDQRNSIVVGRDGRASGAAISHLVISTLQMMGIDVVDLDMATTPLKQLTL